MIDAFTSLVVTCPVERYSSLVHISIITSRKVTLWMLLRASHFRGLILMLNSVKGIDTGFCFTPGT